ncbi:MAG: adenylate kinase family protein, partial [Aggregatilineales bacterium]
MGLYLILMGVQGAGKGVQAQFISEKYGIPHVSTGDMFRAMKKRDDDFAKEIAALMDSGALIDDDTTNKVVADRLSQPDAANGVLLDGYPRNLPQAEFLENLLAEKDEALNGVMLFELNLYVAFKRAFGRVQSVETGESYNLYYRTGGANFEIEKDPDEKFPPRIVATADDTGEVLKRRMDDADAMAVVERIDTYLD